MRLVPIESNLAVSMTVWRRLARSLAAWMVAVCMAAVFSGCDQGATIQFPTLGTSIPTNQESSQPSGSQPTASGDSRSLTVALPLGTEAADAVRLLYLAKKSGLLSQEPGQYIGQEIDPDDLGQFSSGLTINLETLPVSTGATMLQVSLWQASARLPDIIYCQDAAVSLGLDQLVPVNELLFDNDLLSAAHVNANLLESGRVGELIYGIPYLASTQLVYFNQDLLNALNLEQPAADWSWRDWQIFASQAQLAIDQSGHSATPATLASLAEMPEQLNSQLTQAWMVTDNLAGLLAFVPASLNRSAGYAMWDKTGFRVSDDAFMTAARWLNDAVKAGYSLLHLSEDQLGIAFGGTDLTAVKSQGRILLWTGDSTELAEWRQQTAFGVGAAFLPAGSLRDESDQAAADPDEVAAAAAQRMPVTIRSLFISKQSADPALAADFAAFVALDADSLLLQSRYQLFEGLFPVVEDSVVWDALVVRQRYGSFLTAARDRLTNAYCSGQQLETAWQDIIQILEQSHGPLVLQAQDDRKINDLMDQLLAAVNAKQKGG